MKKKEWQAGLDCLDTDVVEGYVLQKEKLEAKRKARGILLRAGAVAACFALILSAVVFVPLLQKGDTPSDTTGAELNGDTTTTAEEEAPDIAPQVSTIKLGNKLTGKQELSLGSLDSEERNAEMLAPGFYIGTVVEATVAEVLPDEYYVPGQGGLPFRVAKLYVTDEIIGKGLPQEIFLKFPFYSADVFDGYDTFVFSLEQVGVENYMMVNSNSREITYFPHMFTTAMITDLGYGSVIAFNDGKVEKSFWSRANHYSVEKYIGTALESPELYFYPVGNDTTIDEAKENILKLAAMSEEENLFVSRYSGDYVCADDVFCTDEARGVKEYLAPSDSNTFVHELIIYSDRVCAVYTRVINGFVTEETIAFNTSFEGEIKYFGSSYTADALLSAPDIGAVIEGMDLSEITPPHIEITDEMSFRHANVSGVYRNVEGKIYGIVRVMWYYTLPNIHNGYLRDDLYLLYDESGEGKIVEREELRDIIGDDTFIARFSYNEWLGYVVK